MDIKETFSALRANLHWGTIVGAAVYVAGLTLDFVESLFWRYGRDEGNSLYRNADGSFDWVTALLIAPPVAIGCAAAAYFLAKKFKSPKQSAWVPQWTFAAMLAGFGVAHGVIGIHNTIKDGKIREHREPAAQVQPAR